MDSAILLAAGVMVLPAAWKISIEPVLVELFSEIAEDQPLKTPAI